VNFRDYSASELAAIRRRAKIANAKMRAILDEAGVEVDPEFSESRTFRPGNVVVQIGGHLANRGKTGVVRLVRTTPGMPAWTELIVTFSDTDERMLAPKNVRLVKPK
jgi:succinyl-CoA synthetase beta subunit